MLGSSVRPKLRQVSDEEITSEIQLGVWTKHSQDTVVIF